ncbi:MAG: hypothetical protein AB7U77_03345, partial [Methanothrix sp.]
VQIFSIFTNPPSRDNHTTFNSWERRGRSGKSPDESEALPASDMLKDNYLVLMQYVESQMEK